MYKSRSRWAIVGLAVAAAVLSGSLAARGGQPQVTATQGLAPNPVTSALDTLYSTSYENTGGTTLTNASILVTLPAGSVFRFGDPDVCTPEPAALDGTIRVTCVRGHMSPGTIFAQQVVFAAPVVLTTPLPITVTSRLKFNERDNDGDTGKQHTDTVSAIPVVTNVYPPSRDLLGKCASKNGETLSTQGASTTKANAQITAAVVPANSSLACSPVVLREVPAGSVAGACPTNFTCRTEISITDSPQFSIANPVLLSFKIDGSLFAKAPDPATFKWFKNGVLVPDCDPFQPLLDPCIESRQAYGTKGIQLGVRWSGNDPSWVGGPG